MNRFLIATIATLAFACGGANVPPKMALSPKEASSLLEAAMKEDAAGSPDKAIDRYLSLAEAGARGGEQGTALLAASLDALVFRRIPGLDRVTTRDALAFRTTKDLRPSLRKLSEVAAGPFARGMIADALLLLANDVGDEEEAAKARHDTACATEATVFGPLEPRAWTELEGDDPKNPDPVQTGKIPAEKPLYAAGPFPVPATGTITEGHGCDLHLMTTSGTRGVRDVYFNVAVDDEGPVGLSLTTNVRATVSIGRGVWLERSVTLGDRLSESFLVVNPTKKGTLLVRVKASIDSSSDQIHFSAWNKDGLPLKITAPRAGDQSIALVNSARSVDFSGTDLVSLSASLALGFDRNVERVLASKEARTTPAHDLLYARALGAADDLSSSTRIERTRSAYESVAAGWKGGWEPHIALAMLQGERKGGDAEILEVLEGLDKGRELLSDSGRALVDVVDAHLSFGQLLRSRAKEARERARKGLSGSRLFTALELRMAEGTPDARARLVCGAKVGRDSFECQNLLRSIGDKAAAKTELARLRRLFGSPKGFLEAEISQLLADRDLEAAKAAFAKLTPGQRSIGALVATDPNTSPASILELAPRVSDGVALMGAFGPAFQGADYKDDVTHVRALLEKSGNLAKAATTVIEHDERYVIAQSGVLHFFLYDLRRVGGTTDVEENAAADLPYIDGRVATKTLRRRIFKADGRVLEPERNGNAQQTHADLAQLEAGDSVEALYEGWAIPDDTGHLGFDSPDLLPARTSVQHARIAVTLPKGVNFSGWHHPFLGTPETKGTERTWTLKNADVRRIDSGTPMMERSVGVSVTTLRWADIARDVRERIALMESKTPDFSAWLKDVTATRDAEHTARASQPQPKVSPHVPFEAVEEIVQAAGKVIRESSAAMLVGGSGDGSQSVTSRTFLTSHSGSRSFLVYEALKARGIDAEIVLAETEPFSSNPNFPAHRDRFRHPFVIAHGIAGTSRATSHGGYGARGDLWIDADVAGPPLPPGKLTPELRGRAVLFSDGRIAEVPRGGEDEALRDDMEVTLRVGEKKEAPGDARGEVKVTLRSRSAQSIASLFERAVGNDRDQVLRQVILGVLPSASVESTELLSPEGSSEISVRANVRIANLVERRSQGKATKEKSTWILLGSDPVHQLYPRGRTSTLSSTFASQGTRDSALSVTRGINFRLKWKIELPAGATLEPSKPYSLSATPFTGGESLVAKRSSKTAANVLEEEFFLDLPPGTVSAENYPAFARLCREIDAAFLRSVSATW